MPYLLLTEVAPDLQQDVAEAAEAARAAAAEAAAQSEEEISEPEPEPEPEVITIDEGRVFGSEQAKVIVVALLGSQHRTDLL